MKRLCASCMISAAFFAAAPAIAQGEDARISIGVTGGTLGIGPEVGYRISKNFGVRGNATFFSIDGNVDSDEIKYDASLDLKSGGLMVDVYPFGGGFRISGGARINGNEASGVASPNNGSNYTIDGVNFTAAQIGTLTAQTEIKDFAPSLTLGYGGGTSRGLSFGFEAGVLFQGSVEVTPLTITGVCSTTFATAGCASIAKNLDNERLNVNEDIDKYKLYPIVQLSVGYRF
jgi:hypothetical protein